MTPQHGESPTTPVASKDLYPETGFINNGSGSEDGTADTDEICTPLTPSSPNNLYDSPSFVLPEIGEDDYPDDDDDNQTHASTKSRMSAAFVQFSPSIQGADQESDLVQMGLNTVDAANKPSHIECVTTINFLSDTNQQQQQASPMPIQVTVASRRSSCKKPMKKTIMVEEVDRLEQQGLRGNHGNDNFSVRSAPSIVRRRNSLTNKMVPLRNQRGRAPNTGIPNQPHQIRPPGVLLPPGPPSRSMSMGPGNNPLRRLSSLPVQRRTSYMPAPVGPETGISNNSDHSSSSKASIRSTASAPVYQDSITAPQRSELGLKLTPKHVQAVTPSQTQRPARIESPRTDPAPKQKDKKGTYSQAQRPARAASPRADPAPKQKDKKDIHSLAQRPAWAAHPRTDPAPKQKDKKGIFSKLFSNQVQADFDDEVLVALRGLRVEGKSRRLSPPVLQEADSDFETPSTPRGMMKDYSSSQSSQSERSLSSHISASNNSLRSNRSNRSSLSRALSVRNTPDSRRRAMCVQADFDDSSYTMMHSNPVVPTPMLRSTSTRRRVEGRPGDGEKKGMGKFFQRKSK